MNYIVMSDDVIRFADKNNLSKFTVAGHSMGGRVAMTLAARFPDRVDGCISLDSPPTDISIYGRFSRAIVRFLNTLSLA